jgi:hypothetical protein
MIFKRRDKWQEVILPVMEEQQICVHGHRMMKNSNSPLHVGTAERLQSHSIAFVIQE